MRCGPALGSPEDWVFKGEGAANIVYSYQGTLPQLVRGGAKPAGLQAVTAASPSALGTG